jgi:hypothetical protein
MEKKSNVKKSRFFHPLAIKHGHEYRYKMDKGDIVHFKLKTKRLKFPLTGHIHSVPKGQTYLFEMFVSASNPRPNMNKYEKKFVMDSFPIHYEGNPEYLFFGFSAADALEVIIVINEKDGIICSKKIF